MWWPATKLCAVAAVAVALVLATPPPEARPAERRQQLSGARSRRVALPSPSGGVELVAAVVRWDVGTGRVTSVAREGEPGFEGVGGSGVVADFGELVLAPGVVDVHAHLNEPGREHWEGFATGTAAAAAGGITTLVDMPLNSDPVTTTAALLRSKVAAARGKLAVDVAFWGGLVPENANDERALGELLDAGAVGLKAFMCPSGIDDFPHTGAEHFRQAAAALKARGKPLMAHAEKALEGAAADEAAAAAARHAPTSHAAWALTRPPAMERSAVDELVGVFTALGAEACPRIHVAHVADPQTASAIAAARAAGAPISGETCAHYLTFAADEVPDGATQFKCAPPLRSAEARTALVESLRVGELSLVASDHSPAPADMKAFPKGAPPGQGGDFTTAWGGIAGLQMLLPATWTALRKAGMGVEDTVRLLSAAPAEVAGLQARKGAIAVGMDADMVAWDPDGRTQLCAGADAPSPPAAGGCTQRNRHRHKLSPYTGLSLDGAVAATIVRGKKVYAGGPHDGLVGDRVGEPVLCL